jgi:ankyrin repeat protein
MSILDPSQRPQKTEEEKRQDFMRSLGFDVMDSRLATIGFAYRETCSWLYTRAEYLRWQDPGSRAEHHGFLWIRGKPGAGKSTLMKHALRHTQSLDQRDTTILSFFFNARGCELEKTTEGMYRSLLHQVYTAFPDRLPGVLPNHSTDPSKHTWQLPILRTMLRDALLNFGNTAGFICYIDALDECAEDDIRLAVEYFEELGEAAISRDVKISICFASRHYPNITMQCYQTLNLDKQKEHHEDIQNFVKGKLRSTGITLLTHAELTEVISGRSSGVFLWAALVVQLLNKRMDGGADRAQLIADLKAVPAGIEDLLKSILTEGSEFLLPTLLWILFGFEPLSASALYPAIKIGAGHLTTEDLEQTETTQEQMQLFILKSSKGLVEFSKGGRATAQFIHESVREHLLNGGLSVLDDSLAENLEAKSHLRLAVWCQNCIELDPHHGFRHPERYEGNIVSYALKSLYPHCEDAFTGGALQLEFLDTIPQSTQSRVLCYHNRQGLLEFLLDEAQECVCLVEGLLQRQLRVFGQVDASSRARNDAIDGIIPYFDVNSSGNPGPTPLLSALYSDDGDWKPIVQLLLACGADPDLESSREAPLFFALKYCQDDVVELLLHHGASPNLVRTQGAGRKTTPLAMVLQLRRPSTDCIGILLERGADPNLMSPDGLPLFLALDATLVTGYCEYTEFLLQHGADPNITSTYNGVTQTPLAMAISQRSVRSVGLLLKHGADANGGSAEFGKPLTNAVSRQPCLQDIVRLLLAHGADSGGSRRHRPLPAAINAQNEAAICLLLDSGADPLLAAITTRNASETRMLLDAGADVRVGDKVGRSYLHVLCLECSSGDQPWKMNSIAEVLLDGGVDIDATDESHKTALIMALEMSYFGLLLLLVRRGADVNKTDMANGTPLMTAARMGALGVMKILLDAGADIDAIDTTRRTALMIAVEMGNFDIARLLVDRGANLTMQGHEGAVQYLRLRMAEEDAVAGLDGCDRMDVC